MILALMLAAAGTFQGDNLSLAAGRERHHPDRPGLPRCDIKAGTVAHTMKDLPRPVRDELARFSAAARGMADAGERYNGTDVIDGDVPGSRFVRGYGLRDMWIVWCERGGIATMMRTVALRPVSGGRGAAPAYRVEPGTMLGGNMCEATKALLAGVRS